MSWKHNTRTFSFQALCAEYGLDQYCLAVSWLSKVRFSRFLYSRFRFGGVWFSKVHAPLFWCEQDRGNNLIGHPVHCHQSSRRCKKIHTLALPQSVCFGRVSEWERERGIPEDQIFEKPDCARLGLWPLTQKEEYKTSLDHDYNVPNSYAFRSSKLPTS